MFVKDVTVQNQVGLHARPATFFIQKANEFKSSIWLEKEERRVNAKSLLGVLSLGIMGGTDIRIIACKRFYTYFSFQSHLMLITLNEKDVQIYKLHFHQLYY